MIRSRACHSSRAILCSSKTEHGLPLQGEAPSSIKGGNRPRTYIFMLDALHTNCHNNASITCAKCKKKLSLKREPELDKKTIQGLTSEKFVIDPTIRPIPTNHKRKLHFHCQGSSNNMHVYTHPEQKPVFIKSNITLSNQAPQI